MTYITAGENGRVILQQLHDIHDLAALAVGVAALHLAM